MTASLARRSRRFALQLDRVPSPLGTLLLVFEGDRLYALDYAGYEQRMNLLLRRRFGEDEPIDGRAPPMVVERLRAYFAGHLDALSDLPIVLAGTPFQESVWAALRRLPIGETATYGALADRIGRPTGSRAVGHANGQNPIAIVVPCHRLVGANGTLTGYAGGLARKRWLLRHEGAPFENPLSEGSAPCEPSSRNRGFPGLVAA